MTNPRSCYFHYWWWRWWWWWNRCRFICLEYRKKSNFFVCASSGQLFVRNLPPTSCYGCYISPLGISRTLVTYVTANGRVDFLVKLREFFLNYIGFFVWNLVGKIAKLFWALAWDQLVLDRMLTRQISVICHTFYSVTKPQFRIPFVIFIWFKFCSAWGRRFAWNLVDRHAKLISCFWDLAWNQLALARTWTRGINTVGQTFKLLRHETIISHFL